MFTVEITRGLGWDTPALIVIETMKMEIDITAPASEIICENFDE